MMAIQLAGFAVVTKWQFQQTGLHELHSVPSDRAAVCVLKPAGFKLPLCRLARSTGFLIGAPDSMALEGFSCTAVVAYLAETKGVSRRTAQRTVQQAYALIREDIDKANVQRSDLVAQAIHLLMESARLGLVQNNPGAVVGAVAQLDKLCGLSATR